MNDLIEKFIEQFSTLSVDDNYLLKIVKIQAWFRGNIFRLKRLPNILYYIQSYLTTSSDANITLSELCNDGRINSSIDEEIIINAVIKRFGKRICKSEKRMWHDLTIKDYIYGWIPVNIKTTTMVSSDNVGNLAICVQSYTNEPLELSSKYDNGKMSNLLIEKIKAKAINTLPKKDYYFLVVNKTNNKDIVVNSLKGLSSLTPNINNLPFQINWNKNREFKYQKISDVIDKFILSIKNTKPSWQETFASSIRSL